MSQNLQSILEAARQLPSDERRRLAEQLLEEANSAEEAAPEAQAEALRIVDELYGSMKGFDRETVIWLAEDEELCGY
jgi:hypothetical protein